MQKIVPFLWFDGQADEAVNFYTSIFKNATITSVTRYGDAGPGPKGSIMSATFELDGQEFYALNGGPMFKFSRRSPSSSSASRRRRSTTTGRSSRPAARPTSVAGCRTSSASRGRSCPRCSASCSATRDAAKANRVMQAMLKMTKLDVAGLQRAYDGQA
jgi:predicted 3-demethylubiquinone-9 3-methyltransferase (glyoxalase superfamily)